MPPRPRPKPKPAAVPASGPSSSDIPIDIDDDSMFIKNKSRSLQAWKKLDEISHKNEARPSKRSSDDEEEEESPRSKKLKKRNDEYAVPQWQKEKNLKRLLSVDREIPAPDDDDSDLEIIESPSKPHMKRKRSGAGTPKRNRSRSLTPPPALAAQEIQATRNIVRQALKKSQKAVQLVEDDDDIEILNASSDTLYEDPELARIAAAVKSKNWQNQGSFQGHDREEEDNSDDAVSIHVKWLPHPQNSQGKERTFIFKVSRQSNLIDLFDATAEEASILETDLVISYKNHRLFSSVTPSALKIYTTAEFVACDKRTYDYIKQHGGFNTFTNFSGQEEASTSGAAPAASDKEDEASNLDVDEDDDDTFQIVLRSGMAKDVHLRVRPTTKCGAIVKAFLAKAGMSPSKKGNAKLSVDGDKMGDDIEISEADLDDGDVVDVIGL